VAPASARSVNRRAIAHWVLGNLNSGGALRPGLRLQRDDSPVYEFQLPAKIDNQEVDFNFSEHLILPRKACITGFSALTKDVSTEIKRG
jgi:hypothetical protein